MRKRSDVGQKEEKKMFLLSYLLYLLWIRPLYVFYMLAYYGSVMSEMEFCQMKTGMSQSQISDATMAHCSHVLDGEFQSFKVSIEVVLYLVLLAFGLIFICCGGLMKLKAYIFEKEREKHEKLF